MGKGFDIIQRSQWGARPRKCSNPRSAKGVTELFIHWPASPGSLVKRLDTPADERAYMREIQNFHMDSRGWCDFAYNYAIMPSGRIYAGRTFRELPAAQKKHNTGTVAICVMIGMTDDIPAAVRENLREFVRWAEKYAGHELKVRAHRDVGGTTCPGDKLTKLARSLDSV